MTDTPQDYDDQFDWDDALGGGLLAGYTAVIRNPEFGIDEEYNDATVRLMVELEVTVQPDPDFDFQPGHVFHEAYNVGNTDTWEAVDGGAAAVRLDGKRAKVNPMSTFGRIVGAITGNNFGDSEKTKMVNHEALLEIIRERGSAFKAATWDGLEFVWDRVDASFTNKKTGEVVNFTPLYPVEFVGVAEPSEGGAASSGSTNGKVDDEDWDVIAADLEAKATEFGTHGEFFAYAMQAFPNIATSPIADDVIDKEGMYARAQA